MKLSRYLAACAAASLVVMPTMASAVTTSVDYSAIYRATEKAAATYKSQVAACAGDAACLKQADKTLKSAQFRIASASSNSDLTDANQRATARQLTEILNRSVSCSAADAATCAKQNSKTLGSLLYRITNQAPISPV
ncbi:hypothetical protein [Sphingobium sp. CECT 9361]|uniref:hypothetical protein n=1 Tax=Sphingobium sp. CECT 9361 TaxID=2845384 RepID=UPI001E631810|nr:hypothetical protein [Sphingobium sp. CECT 9361]CAH0356889.1 hypothetical protein SPH9361_04535 [Sphingobium sp. CECT 9361]